MSEARLWEIERNLKYCRSEAYGYIEGYIDFRDVAWLVSEHKRLKAERDELLEAAKVAKAAMDADGDAVANVYEVVSQAIAKAEGRDKLLGDILEQVKELTESGWNFKLVLDHAYLKNSGFPSWQATFWHPHSSVMDFADGDDPWMAMSTAVKRLFERGLV